MKHRNLQCDRNDRRTDVIRFRTTKGQKAAFTRAARRAGITLSAWLIERATAAARVESANR